MPEEDKPVNPKGVKGVSTIGGPSITVPDYKPYYEYTKPTTDKDKFLAGITGNIMESSLTPSIKNTSTLLDGRLASLYTPINLAKAIPDQFEREKYIAEHGSKMVQLLDPNKYGIRFNSDALDYSIFKAKNYDIQLKKFLDDLDENQGFLAALGNTGAKLVGKTATAVGGLIPLTYGIGASLFSWDSKKLFDNTLFDAWESADHYLDRKFAVYGGADYSKGDKSFFGRFVDNPMKSINADIIPAAAFVAGAVLTEFAAGAITAATGGAAGGVFAANTARLAAQSVNLFSKGVRIARGLDTLSDFNNMRKIVDLTQKIRTGIGTATTMVRTAGYESSLIARDTQKRTELQGRLNYIQSNPQLNEEAKVLAEQGYTEQEISEKLSGQIDPSVLSRIDYAAEQAGELAWFSNVPLVGFSNIIQFGKSLNFSYRLGNTLNKASKINPLRGTVINEAGEMVSKASVATRGQKVLGYGMTVAKGGLTESFEEFSQGAMEQGYSDFYASQFKSSNIKNSTSFIDSMVKATRNYWNSTEGKDSMTIGALMGMLGIPLPVSIDAQTGKAKLGMQWYGGAYGEIKELRKDIARDKEIADLRNKSSINPVLKNNFENAIKNMDIQDDMDEAIKNQDVFTFKNKEFEQYHTFVNTRYKNGVADTIYQDLDALDQMDLKTFNDQYAFKGFEFTEETKKEAVEKTRKQTKEILASHKEVETLFNDSRLAVDNLFNKKYRDADGKLMFGLKKADGKVVDIETAYEFMDVLQNELVYLHSTNKNLNKREKELKEQIGNLTENKFNTSVTNKIVAKAAGVSEKDSEISIEYATSARELYKAQLAELKQTDPILYDLVEAQLKPLLQDLVKLNDNKAKNAALYNTLFTKKGARDFINLHAEYTAKKGEVIKEAILKQREEETNKARTSGTVKKGSIDEEALNGTNTIASNKATAEMDAMNEALSNIAAQEGVNMTDLSDLINNVDGAVIVEQLQKSPALFLEVLEYLKNQGTPLGGVTNIDQLSEMMYTDLSLIGKLSNALMALREEYNKANVVPPTTLEYADTTDENDVTPSNNTSLADLYKGKLEELNALSIFQTGSNVSEQAIIPLTHDKKITGGEVERDEATGKFKSWYFVNDAGQIETSDQPLDTALINSPEFLNNEELNSKVINATFEVEETQPYKVDGKLVEITPRNIKINIYHNNVFIGRLPAFKDGMASHLLALREAVVAQEAVTTTNEIWNNSGTKFTGKSFVAKDGNTYTIEESELKSGDKVIKVKDKDGKTVSSAYFTKNEDGTYSIKKGTRVESEIQGIGLASAIYNYFDKNIGKIKRTDTTTDEGDNLWNSNKNRINAKYDADSDVALLQQEVDRLRAEEQVEKATIKFKPVINEQGEPINVAFNKKAQEKSDKLYDKYDKLISPLLAKIEATTNLPNKPAVPSLITVKVELEGLSIDELKNVVTQLKQKEVDAKNNLKQGKQVLITDAQYKGDREAVKAYIAALETVNKETKEVVDKNFEDIIIQIANSKDAIFFNENNEFKNCK